MTQKNKYLHSKWTSIKKINGWRHYEVKNVLLKTKELEIFSVCDKTTVEIVSFNDIRDRKKWRPGWEEIVQ